MFSNELIISTYNNPVSLDLVLYSLAHQTSKDFKLCVADDGSSAQTTEVIEKWYSKFEKGRLRHVWQEDKGFRKNKILNAAIKSSSSDYLIFIDGDCIASRGFIENHLNRRKKNSYLSGGMVRMPASVNSKLNYEIIDSEEIFSYSWLKLNKCIKSTGDFLKASILPGFISRSCEKITPVKCTWNGANSSGWLSDILKVNGFDESMEYGSEDIDLGYRLNNAGINGLQIRYSANLLHINHDRPYANIQTIKKNKIKAQFNKHSNEFFCKDGIEKLNNLI